MRRPARTARMVKSSSIASGEVAASLAGMGWPDRDDAGCGSVDDPRMIADARREQAYTAAPVSMKSRESAD